MEDIPPPPPPPGVEVKPAQLKVQMKRCVCPRHEGEKMQPITNFGEHPSSRDGRQSYCKVCRNGLHKIRREKDPAFYLTHHIATRVRQQVGVEGYPPGFTKEIGKYLGYPMAELVRHLNTELQAREGIPIKTAIKRGYHLDHKHPLSLFGVTSVDSLRFQECWAISNLWMIPAAANLAKSDTVLSGDELANMVFSGKETMPKLGIGGEKPAEKAVPRISFTAQKPAESAPKPPSLADSIWQKAFG